MVWTPQKAKVMAQQRRSERWNGPNAGVPVARLNKHRTLLTAPVHEGR